MLELDYRLKSDTAPPPSQARARTLEIGSLHARCGVYTRPEIVRQILDAVGWRASSKLFNCRLLEPAAGDGEFVVEAARRLVVACRKFGVTPSAKNLQRSIRAFEIHPREARRARRRIVEVLRGVDVSLRTAESLAKSWITVGDFLLTKRLAEDFTHVVGNPPFIRWSKIPTGLERKYRRALPREMIGGDLFLPFLDRALTSLTMGGRCGLLCSDRWRYAAFAKCFRLKWLPRLNILSEEELLATSAFTTDVDTYPTILIARIRKTKKQAIANPPIVAQKSLLESGYTIKVGPALGCTAAYVLQPNETDVEDELLYPWVDSSEIIEGSVAWRGRRVASLYGEDGSLLSLTDYPRAGKRLQRFKGRLKKRSIVANGAKWFQPIDRVIGSDWAEPKLLIPEIAKVPRVALDYSGAIPSHGVYAIFAPGKNIASLYGQLADGGLARALEGISPKIKGGYVRCYKHFLAQIKLS